MAITAACLAACTWAGWAAGGSLGVAVSVRAAEAIRNATTSSAYIYAMSRQPTTRVKVLLSSFRVEHTGTVSEPLRARLSLAQQNIEGLTSRQLRAKGSLSVVVFGVGLCRNIQSSDFFFDHCVHPRAVLQFLIKVDKEFGTRESGYP